MDLMIIRMVFPNDPTRALKSHQMYVAIENTNTIEFYSISSILGKETRVFGSEGINCFKIIGNDQNNNGFKSPSFIDCSKSYSVVKGSANYSNLAGRNLQPDLVKRINKKIEECKNRGVHVSYSISETDLKSWNNRL